jgi:hypothetical protein
MSQGESKRSTAGWTSDVTVQLGHTEYWASTMLAPSTETTLAIITFIHQHQEKRLHTTTWSSLPEQQRMTAIMATTASINKLIDEALRLNTAASIMDTIRTWPEHSEAQLSRYMMPWTNTRLGLWKESINNTDPSMVHLDHDSIGSAATVLSLLVGVTVWVWRRDGRFSASLILTIDHVIPPYHAHAPYMSISYI